MNAFTPGGHIDTKQQIVPVRIAVLTISDTRDEESDTSGHVLAERITGAGHELAAKGIVKDDVGQIREQITAWVESGTVDAIITTGGTGITGRDVTPEAVEPLFDKKIDGFSVIFHLVSYQSVGLSTLQSRAVAGLIKGVFVFCLPGSNGAVKDGWDKVISAQLDSRHGPCNMVELMPRLLESKLGRLTHIDETGRAHMVDVSDKAVTAREAVAAGFVRMTPETLALALSGDAKKGDVRATAEIAGIMAAKKTSELIPLCHPLAISKVEVRVAEAEGGLAVTARVKTTGQTGVEMEALTAVSVACLTVYDMLKAADKAMTIEAVRLMTKTGGKSGDWTRP